MGITGLIPFLEKSSSKVQLKDLRGSTVAVDTYCWLHKGVFCCAEKLVRGEDTDLYLQYCMKYVNMLLSYDIKPILVFDGRHLPAKALTESRRRESRQQSKKRAAELLRLGRTDEARSHMRRCVDVTHEMALRLIRECRQRNVDCIVAPYEADAQMAWLNKVDLAQYIVTEDSDLTLFGARKVIFKLDLTGTGLLVEANKLHLAMGCAEEKYTFDKFRRMCILSGCDYLDSLTGIGLAKACKFMMKTEEDDMWRALKKIPQYLNMRNLEVDDEYIENFLKAEATFKHMYIYNPLKRQMERLNALEDFGTDERYICNAGTLIEDDEQALQLALGNLNPFSLKKLDNWHPDKDYISPEKASSSNKKRAKHKSIWQGNFKPRHSDTKQDTKTLPSCALYFKKVDFISKTIDADITANIKEENAKPEEAEIFSMYAHEAEEHERPTTTKRRRRRSSSVSSSIDNDSPSPVDITASHNPFAKAHKSRKDDCREKSPAICENSSLLRVLSPSKCKNENMRQVTRENSFKRSIFAKVDEQVEIKSRFFAANIKQASKTRQDAIAAPDLSEEIDKIESLAQQNQTQQLQLYNSPSPRKNVHTKVETISPSCADSGIGSIADNNNTINHNEDPKRDMKLRSIEAAFDSSTILELNAQNIKEDVDDAIVLSDEDDDNKIKTKTTSIQDKPAAFKSQTTTRLGLSKPKTKSCTKSNLKSTKKSSISAASPGQNQTRLSMFGFQKRPTLK